MAGKRKDFTLAVALYEQGLSIGDVAKQYGVTRQSMWRSLRIRGVKMRPKLRFGAKNHFYRGGSTASDRAQNTLEVALRKGVVGRPDRCQKCRRAPSPMKGGRSRLQAHHPDYNKPLDVMWLCQACHHEWHKRHHAVPRRKSA
jgi:hypothetical protein